jgi:hypothetical protein
VEDRDTSRPWPEIVEFYRDLVERGLALAPMLRLVEQLAASRLSMLHGMTSMLTLCLGQTPRLHPAHDVLRIEFAHGSFRLEYIEDETYTERRWQKTCGPADGFATVEHFVLDLAKWIRL